MLLKLKRFHLLHYGVAALTVAIALILTQLLFPLLELTPSPLFFAAVAISAWYGGMGSGLLATILAAVAIHYFFREPISPFAIKFADVLLLTVFGFVSLLIGSLTDARRRAVVALQKKEDFLRLIADALPVPISYVDVSERYRFNNQTYEEWFKLSRTEITGKPLKELLGEQAYQVIQGYVTAALSGQKVTYETEVPFKDGFSRYIHATYIPDVGKNGHVKGFVAHIEDITERKQAAENLRESEERLRLALDAAQMGTWDWNLVTGRVTRSPMIDRLFGITPGSVSDTYENFLEGIHPEDRQCFHQTLNEAIKNQTAYEIEFRILKPTGAIRWLISKGQVLRDRAGVPLRLIGVCMDVTDSKYASEALLVSEERFKSLFESNLIGLAFGDHDGNITEANNAFLELVKYSQNDLRSGRVRWSQITPPEYRHLDQLAMDEGISSGGCTPYEKELIRKDGSRVPVLVGRTQLEDYTNLGISFILDLSERKRAQEALKESEERLRLALESAHMGTWDWKISTGEITHSEIVDRLLGFEPGTFGGTYNSLIKIVHPEDRPAFNQAVIDTIERGADFNIEFRAIQSNNTVRWVASIGKRLSNPGKKSDAGEASSASIEDSRGDRLIGVCMDITERKQIEQERHRRQQEFTALAENAPDIIARMDRDGRYLYVNQAIEQATGIPPTAFMGKTFLEAGFPEAIDTLWQHSVDTVLESGQQSIIESNLPTPNGIRHYQSRLVPELSLDGSIAHVICISRDITELKQAEEALRETNQTLKALIQACPLAIMVLDPDANVKMWNRGAQRIFGWSEEEVLGRPLRAIPEDKQLELRSNIQATLQGQPLMGFETRRQTKEGIAVDVAIWTASLRDAKGNLSYLSLVADITDRKRAQEALAQSEERFRTLVDSMDDLVFTLDREGRYTGVFGRWMEKTQATPEAFIGKTPEEIYEPEAAAIHEAAHKTAIAGEHVVYEWSFESEIGHQYCQTSLSPLRDVNGDAIGIVGVGRDITARHRAEQAQCFLSEASKVLASSLDYRTTLYALASLAVPTIADYCIIYMVEEGGKIYRLAMAHIDPAKEALLQELERLYPLDLSQEDGIVNVIKTGKPVLAAEVSDTILSNAARDREHLKILRQLGAKSCIIVPLVARGRTLGGMSFTAAESGRRYGKEDLMLIEELSRRAAFAVDNARLYRESQEANRIKDEFLAIVSHELRTPLNSMLGWAQLLRTRQFDRATTERALETIERNARAQTQLIEDLLDVSRILRGKISLSMLPVDLSQTIDAAIEAVRPSAEAKAIAISKVINPEVGRVLGDFNRLQQVVWNLLSNAIKFTPNGGRVQIELQRSRSFAEIQVSDTGMGISREFLPLVFDRFRQADSTTTRSHGGLGLGLAIVRHLVDLQGGSVFADSPGEGCGATFTVQLPLLEEIDRQTETRNQLLEAIEKVSGSDLPLEGLQVLVVDDDRDTLEFLTTTLKMAGASVRGVSSVSQALEAISDSAPEILVSDIGMPERDGYELIRQVRSLESASESHSLPAVALTAYARDSDRAKALDAGFNQHVPKPIDPDRLVAVVAELAAMKK